jgi:hypothetical protein
MIEFGFGFGFGVDALGRQGWARALEGAQGRRPAQSAGFAVLLGLRAHAQLAALTAFAALEQIA